MSDNPTLEKLKIKPDQKIAVINQPAGYLEALGNLPDGVLVDSEMVRRYDLIHAFLHTSKNFECRSKT